MRPMFWVSVAALIAGLALGVLYSWVISPLRYVDTTPSTLRSDFKDAFRTAIAASYAATHNLDRAKARLALLGDADSVEALTAQAQRMLASGEPFQVVQDVAALASDLRSGIAALPPVGTQTAVTSPSASTVSATASISASATASETGEPTATEVPTTELPAATRTAHPTATPIPTASKPFELVSQDEVCKPDLTNGLLQISVLDSRRHQMPGVEIDISWSDGAESFFTGLKPEIGDGYADFVMQPGTTYAIRVARSGAPIPDLSAPSCPDTSGGTFLGGLKLVFQQP